MGTTGRHIYFILEYFQGILLGVGFWCPIDLRAKERRKALPKAGTEFSSLPFPPHSPGWKWVTSALLKTLDY